MDTELLNDEDVATVMRRKLGRKDFSLKNWSLDRVESTDGFLGQYHKVRVVCAMKDGNEEKFVFFAKTKPPRISPQYDFAVTADVFKREIIFYEDIVKGMGKGEGPRWIVDFYLGKDNAIIVMEDATLDGFGMPDKFVPFDYDDCVAMFYAMAKLHSRSVVLDEKLRRDGGQSLERVYGKMLEEVMFPSVDRTRRNFINSGIQGACGFVDLIDGLDDRSKKRLKNVITDWAWRLPKFLRASNKYRSVLCHRDPWANNMLIKRDPTDGRPIGFYLIDFQFIRYLPPAVDFMLALYLTTRRNVRDVNFDKFTKVYHDLVREELRRENLDIDECNLCWNVYRESCEYYRLFAIIYATVCQQIMLIDEQSADKYVVKSPELLERVFWGPGRQELVCPIFAKDRRYRERISENIMEIYEKLDDFENWHGDD